MAWTAANKDVSTVILGATKKSQLHENIKSLDLLAKWSHEIDEKVDGILGNKPEEEMNYKSSGKWAGRRTEQLYIEK